MLCKECPDYFPLGCVKHCEVIDLNLVAPIEGTYTIDISSVSKCCVRKFYKAGDNITLDTSNLNECSEACLKVFMPDGSLMSFQDGGCTYLGFNLETVIYV